MEEPSTSGPRFKIYEIPLPDPDRELPKHNLCWSMTVEEYEKKKKEEFVKLGPEDEIPRMVVLEEIRSKFKSVENPFKVKVKFDRVTEWVEIAVNTFGRTCKLLTVETIKAMYISATENLKNHLIHAIVKKRFSRKQVEDYLCKWKFYTYIRHHRKYLEKFEDGLWEEAELEAKKQSNKKKNNELDVTFEDDSVTEGDAPDADDQSTGQPPKKRRKIKETSEDAKDQSDDKDDDGLDLESEPAVKNVPTHKKPTPRRTRRSIETSNPKAGSSEQMQNADDVTQQRNSGSAGGLSDDNDDDDGFEQKQKPGTPNRNVQTPNKTPASWERQRAVNGRFVSKPIPDDSQPPQNAADVKQQRKPTQKTSENTKNQSDDEDNDELGKQPGTSNQNVRTPKKTTTSR